MLVAFKKLLHVLIGIATLGPFPAIAAECGSETRCILVIGDSITRHGPSPAVGWTGDWGMAASARETDYVSQLVKLLTEDSGGETSWAERRDAVLVEKNQDNFKLASSTIQLSRKADLVIVQLGNNFTPDRDSVAAFSKSYFETLSSLQPLNGVLACVGTWWTSQVKDQIIQERCRMVGGIYVDISGLQGSPENLAGKERSIVHKGVAAHPGDRGMKAIAERVFRAIQR